MRPKIYVYADVIVNNYNFKLNIFAYVDLSLYISVFNWSASLTGPVSMILYLPKIFGQNNKPAPDGAV